jgi:small subunit ribosomal protein S18
MAFRPQRKTRKKVFFRKKVCRLCENKNEKADYKDIKLLRNFITERGKIIPRRVSGNCAPHQRQLTVCIKQARNIAFIPFAEK